MVVQLHQFLLQMHLRHLLLILLSSFRILLNLTQEVRYQVYLEHLQVS